MNKLDISKRNTEKEPHIIREKGFIPGTIKGPSVVNTSIKVAVSDLEKALDRPGEIYQVDTKNGPIMVKFDEIEKHPISREFMNFTMIQMPKGIENEIDIPLNLKGMPVGVEKGGVLVILKEEITVNGKPREIPSEVVVNISNMDIGDMLTVKDLNIPGDVDSADNDKELIAICKSPKKEVFLETYDPYECEDPELHALEEALPL
jgi:large subunit ribosomal protein L25